MKEVSAPWYLLCYTYIIDGEPTGQSDVTFRLDTPKFMSRNIEDLREQLRKMVIAELPEPREVAITINSLTFLCEATEEEFYS